MTINGEHSAQKETIGEASAGDTALINTAIAENGKANAESSSADAASASRSDQGWVATWVGSIIAATPYIPNLAVNGFSNQTLRQCIFTSVGGSAARLRLSNRYGERPLRIAKVAIGVRRRPVVVEMVSDTAKFLTFSGSRAVVIEPGEEVISDVLAIDLLAHQELLIDIFLPGETGPANFNKWPGQSMYSAPGDHAGDEAGVSFEKAAESQYYISCLDVFNPKVAGTIVACADSLSHAGPQVDTNMKWPQILSRRLRVARGDNAPSVVQSTMSGNRLLTSSNWGPSTLSRFERDVLSQTGIKCVILLVGINDMAWSQQPPELGTYSPTTNVSAEQIIDGYQKLIEKTRALGIRIFGCTIPPASGTLHYYSRSTGAVEIPGQEKSPESTSMEVIEIWNPAAEVKRQAVNTWIRKSSAFDGFFDFAVAVENPLDHEFYDPSCSLDSIHPSGAGQYAFANSIDLTQVEQFGERIASLVG